MMQMDIYYIINQSLGNMFDTSDLRSYEYSRLGLLLLRYNNLYFNRVQPNETLYFVY